jgi:hypothetical protein
MTGVVPERAQRGMGTVADVTAGVNGWAGPWVEGPWFERELAERSLPDDVQALARSLHVDGYAVLPGLIGADLIARIQDDLVQPLAGRNRLQDAWRTSDAVRELAVMPAVLDVLRALYGREPIPFQTLNFEVGTQQEAHSDTVHFSSLPSRFMCGVWVALEDTDAGNGPLFYHPGSHRLPDPTFQRFGLAPSLGDYDAYALSQREMMEAQGIDQVEYHARAGDALIWSANLVHGGRPITEPGRSRWSQVTHYFFDGCVHVTPMFSEPDLGEWFVRSSMTNIATGEPVEQSLNGQPVHLEDLGNGRSRVHRGAKTVPFAGELVADLDAENARLRAEVETLRHQAAVAGQELAAVRGSRALRVGRLATAPARWLRSLRKP